MKEVFEINGFDIFGGFIGKHKKVVTKEYPKSRAKAWVRTYYNGDRQNQEDHS